MTVRRAAVAAVLLAALALSPLALRPAGAWLVVEDPLQPADAIVVLAGQVPFRAMEAAKLYRTAPAREVWVSRGQITEEDRALARIGLERWHEDQTSTAVLEKLGVPQTAIHLLDGSAADTADEVRLIQRRLAQERSDRVIIVTSKSHTRRVKVIWQKLVGATPTAIVRYAEDDPFDASHWWRSTEDGLSVAREWLGLFNAWAGFPVQPRR